MTLAEMWRQLHDPAHWPPVPERPLMPVTDAELAAMTLSSDQIDALLSRRVDPKTERRRALRVQRGAQPV